jgi:RTX calcium-binding nonapeptide repeat (4 copies)
VAASAVLGLGFASSSSASLTSALIDKELRLSSDVPNEVNHATIELDDNDGLVFRDSKAGVSAGVCPVSGASIVCGNIFGNVKRVRFDLGGGNDQFSIIDPRLIVFPRVRVFMGAGNDQVLSLFTPLSVALGTGDDFAQTSVLADKVHGDGGNDRLAPGPGDDIVSGDSGDDVVRGGWRKDDLGEVGQAFGRSDGRDKLFGGGGKDKVLAKDFTKDKRIDCGGGSDTLRRDRFDPVGKHCE